MKFNLLFIIINTMLLFAYPSISASSSPDIELNSDIHPINLRCEYLINPLGIDIPSPHLSWNLISEKRNQMQYAYQILASESEDGLKLNQGNLWDTGKIIGDQCLHIRYKGKELSSRMKIYWKVRVWDNEDKPSDWSSVAEWEMSFLEKSDWGAKWIGTGEDKNPDTPKTDPAPYFRKEFKLQGEIKSARAYVSGLGYYEFYLNGLKIGDQVLAPAQTNYDHRHMRKLLYPYDDQSDMRVFYHSFDVSQAIKDGINASGIILGNGWYNQRDRTAEGWLWYDTPRFILQIEIVYSDGQIETIYSDESWKYSTGPILHDAIFTGEIYDARLELRGWSESGYDDKSWMGAKIVRSPLGELESQLVPHDKVIDTIKPVAVTKLSEDVFVYDLGQMFSGWVRLNVEGKKGDIISIRYIEELGKDYRQKDQFILSGNGKETYEPRFTWHAFRHVEISGAPYALDPGDMLGIIVNTAVDTAGYFECSNKLFNKIYQNYIWTQLGNFHGAISSDCPHRERIGYTGDGQILAETSMFCFDMTQFYRKWTNDMADAQNSRTGFVPHSAPFGGGGGGPAWGSAYVTVPWFYYLYYNDVDILRQHYQGMKHWIDYLGTRTDEGGIIVREEPGGWCLGDWAAPGSTEVPPPLVNTAYYYYITTLMADVAKILQENEDNHHFSNLAEKIRKALNDRYFNRDAKMYWEGRQGSDVFPLIFNMVDESAQEQVLQSLLKNIIKNKGHLDTGILATPLMLELLSESGYEDLAFTIMNQRGYPGFGDYIIGKKATSLWENWDGKSSHSHPMYGSVIRWFYKYLAGINPDPKDPGFKHIIIKPVLAGDLTFARAGYKSIYGKIVSEWQIEEGNLHLKVEIPVNTRATVYIPAVDPKFVYADGQSINGHDELTYSGRDQDYTLIELGSGNYEFYSKNIAALIKPIHVSTPQIFPTDTLVLKPGTAKFSIESATEGADIYYTLDGTLPDKQAQKYGGSFLVSDNIKIKAKAYRDGYLPSFVKTVESQFSDPAVNGLTYTVYEGEWDQRPDTTLLNPVSKGEVFQFNLDQIKRREDYVAIIFEGYIDILESGDYTFFSSANDGSVLYIEDNIVVDNAGYKGKKAYSGKINLTAGRKSLKVLYYENSGSESIDIYYAGPGFKKRPIPPHLLYKAKGKR